MRSAPPPPSSASTTTAPAMIGIQGIRRCGRATTVGGATRTVAALSRPARASRNVLTSGKRAACSIDRARVRAESTYAGTAGLRDAGGAQLDLVEHAFDAVGRRASGEQRVDRRRQGVLVGAGIGARSAVLLGRRVAGRQTARTGGGLRLVELFGQAEVDQDRFPVWLKLDVGGLDVAMDDGRLARVQVGECVAQRVGPLQDLCHRRGVALDTRVQVLALDEIHRQVLPAFEQEVVGDARQVRVAQAGKQRRLAVELALRIGADA